MTFDLRTPNSNLTCIFVSSTYTSKIFKIRPTFLKLLRGNQFEYIMSCDLWPADTEFELDLYSCVIYLHIKNIQNPSNIFEVIARKPIWIYELWPLTCELRIRTWPVFLCHLPTHQKYSKSVQHFWSYCAETNLNIWAVTFDLWPADSKFELDLYFSVIYLHIKNIQNPSNIFEVIARKPIRGTDRRTDRGNA